MTTTFEYIIRDRDRHGNVRVYVRAPGKAKIRLRSDEGTEAFALEYLAARSGKTLDAKGQAVRKFADPGRKGTFRWLVDHYYASKAFADLDKVHTQVERRRQLDKLVEKIGDKPAIMPVETIKQGVRDRQNAAARKWISALRHVYAVGVEDKKVAFDPTAGIKVKKPKTAGFHSWTPAECQQFEDFYPLGTVQRAAFAVGLYLGCRRSDAVRIGYQNELEDGTMIAYTQHKGRNRSPVDVVHPIVPPLRQALDALSRARSDASVVPIRNSGLYLATAAGEERSDKSFGGSFAYWCKQAGLPPGCSFHGLRKALGARLADLGASTFQVQAVLGDKTLQQAEVYTRQADKKRQAKAAMGALFGVQPGVGVARAEVSHFSDAVGRRKSPTPADPVPPQSK